MIELTFVKSTLGTYPIGTIDMRFDSKGQSQWTITIVNS